MMDKHVAYREQSICGIIIKLALYDVTLKIWVKWCSQIKIEQSTMAHRDIQNIYHAFVTMPLKFLC